MVGALSVEHGARGVPTFKWRQRGRVKRARQGLGGAPQARDSARWRGARWLKASLMLGRQDDNAPGLPACCSGAALARLWHGSGTALFEPRNCLLQARAAHTNRHSTPCPRCRCEMKQRASGLEERTSQS